MAVIAKSDLKDYFRKGDKPTELQFGDLIDSLMHAESSEFKTISASIAISSSNIISTTSSLSYVQPTQDEIPNIIVSGNILPVPDDDSFTSSFSLGSSTHIWKDIFVSENSIHFMKKDPLDPDNPKLLAKIQIDKDQGDEGDSPGTADKLMFRDPEGDHMDVEARMLQAGKSRGQGFSFEDGNSPAQSGITSPFGKMQNYVGDGKGQQFTYRPEAESFLQFGRKSKAHQFGAEGGGSVAFNLKNFDADRNGFFRIEKETTLAGFGKPLFEVHENREATFFRDSSTGEESKIVVEGTIESTGGSFIGGNTVIEEAVTVQPGIISQSINIGTPTSPSNLEMVGVGDNKSITIADNQVKQITQITFPFSSISTSSLQDASLAASGAFYFAKPDGAFFTFTFNTPEQGMATSGVSGSIYQATLTSTVGGNPVSSGSSGLSSANQIALTLGHTINNQSGFSTVIDFNKVIVTSDNPGETIDASTSFPSTTASIATTVQGKGVEVRINNGSTLRIISQQPVIIADSDTGTVTLSDPDVLGNGDIIFNPDNGGNPSLIKQNTTIPKNHVAYWTVNNVPGTYINLEFAANPGLTATGIQIGADRSVPQDGIIVNDVVISPAYGNLGTIDTKLKIEEGAKLYIQPQTQVIPVEGGTNIKGQTTFTNDLTVGTNTVTLTPEGHITASGNISASGAISASSLHADGLDYNTGVLTITDSDLAEPKIIIHNTTAQPYGEPELVFKRDQSSDDTDIGVINFEAKRSDGAYRDFVTICGEIAENQAGQEGGQLRIEIKSHDGETVTGFTLTDGDAEDEVDVTIGNTTTSLTTIAGDLQVNGNDIKDDDGTTCITFDSSGKTQIGGSSTPTTIGPGLIDFNPEANANGVQFKVDDTNSKTIFSGLIEFELNANRIELGQSATQHVTASGNISASGDLIATSLNLPNITSAASTDASHYSVNGKRVEVRSQLQSGVAADTGWTLELRNTSVAVNSLIVANVIGGAGAIITGSVVSANVVAANTASLNFYNIGAAIADDAAFTASIAIF